ncbi:MAG: YkgJ family cysteine cluster protein [Desulfarculaceae bacterium]
MGSGRQPFECQRCGACCVGAGGIYLEPEEVPAAARLVGLSEQDFRDHYCIEANSHLEVKCNQKGVCALMGPQGCLIHQAKPAICRLWPFFPGILKDAGALEEAKLACPGIDPEISHAEFVEFYHRHVKNRL